MMAFSGSGVRPSRRSVLKVASGAAIYASVGLLPYAAKAAPPLIRYSTGGGIGPTEIETIIFLDWMKQNVLPHHGKDYTVDFTFTRSTPEAATLLAAGQVDIACQSWAIFATSVLKDAIPGGATIIADNFREGRPDYANGGFYVLRDSPIRTMSDLKGKTVGVNAFGSASELVLRVILRKAGLDPKKDIQIVEIPFPALAPAIYDKRIDCGTLVLPFQAADRVKRDLRPLFTDEGAFGAYSVIFEVVRNDFLKQYPAAVKAFLADYIYGLRWLYDPANRAKAVELAADLTKSPPATIESYFLTNKDYYRDLNGCITPSLLQGPVDAMVKEGFLPAPVDMSKFINTSYLPAACPA